jgi:hypothetical protein
MTFQTMTVLCCQHLSRFHYPFQKYKINFYTSCLYRNWSLNYSVLVKVGPTTAPLQGWIFQSYWMADWLVPLRDTHRIPTIDRPTISVD